MKTKILAFTLSLLICFVMAAPFVLGAGLDLEANLNNTGAGIYGEGEQPSKELPVIIGNIINIILGFAGVILVVMIIIGGFYYMTAGGEKDGVEKGKKFIINGIIGLVIILAAYGITTFVVTKLATATGTVY